MKIEGMINEEKRQIGLDTVSCILTMTVDAVETCQAQRMLFYISES